MDWRTHPAVLERYAMSGHEVKMSFNNGPRIGKCKNGKDNVEMWKLARTNQGMLHKLAIENPNLAVAHPQCRFALKRH